VLSRFRKDELPSAVRWLGRSEEVSKRRTKRDIVSSTLEAFAESKASEHAITELELQYVLTHPNSLQWKAYSLKYANVWMPSIANTDPQLFCKRFQFYLGDMDYDLADALKSPHHWLALHIVGRGHTSYTCHIIRCPLSPCVLLAGVRKQHLSWILDALCLTIECVEWGDTELSGRSLNSLLDLLLNQASQGPYSAYRLNQKDPNPLLAVRRKRHRLQHDYHSEQGKRLKAAEDTFGTNPLPKLERFTFKLEAPLAGSEELIQCSVKLSGSSVLQGVKQCILSDLVALPVPTVLTALHSSGSNSVLVQHSTATEHSLRQSRSVEDKENELIDKT
jgi:hypothetical protein